MLRIVFFAVFVCVAQILWANPYSDGMDRAEIEALINEKVAPLGHQAVVHISKYRRFPACSMRPQVTPLIASWETVELHCLDAVPWKRAVRTAIKSIPKPRSIKKDTHAGKKYVVLAKSVRRGDVLEINDLELTSAASQGYSDAFDQVVHLVGRRMNAHLGAGRVVLARHLEQEWMVLKGSPVQIVYSAAGVEILAPGQAVENGQLGDLIQVRNSASSHILRGFVSTQNKIKVIAKIK